MIRLVRFVIVFALLTQVTHAAWVFENISRTKGNQWDFIMSYVFAISLETSIFIFTMEAKVRIAIFFAVVSTLINLLYYWIQVGFTLEFWSMVVISPIIPTTIYYYSELITDDRDKKAQELVPQSFPEYVVPEPITTVAQQPVQVNEPAKWSQSMEEPEPILQTFENGEPVNPLREQFKPLADSAQEYDFIDRIEPTPPGAWGMPKISNKKMGKTKNK